LFWIRRLAPFIVLAVIVLGYLVYDHITTTRRDQEVRRYALATAQVWLASARLRNDSDAYFKFRDSLLDTYSLSPEQIQTYLNRYQKRPEKYELFAELVKQYVDSLYEAELHPSDSDTVTSTVLSGDST
jgi:hypothetical protein